MCVLKFVVILLMVFGPAIYGYGGLGVGLPIGDFMRPIQRHGIQDEQAMEYMETMFLKKMFTDHMMKNHSVIFDEEDEEYMSMKAQNDMMNDMFSYEMAKRLAKQDVMNLRPYFESQGWLKNSSK